MTRHLFAGPLHVSVFRTSRRRHVYADRGYLRVVAFGRGVALGWWA